MAMVVHFSCSPTPSTVRAPASSCCEVTVALGTLAVELLDLLRRVVGFEHRAGSVHAAHADAGPPGKGLSAGIDLHAQLFRDLGGVVVGGFDGAEGGLDLRALGALLDVRAFGDVDGAAHQDGDDHDEQERQTAQHQQDDFELPPLLAGAGAGVAVAGGGAVAPPTALPQETACAVASIGALQLVQKGMAHLFTSGAKAPAR